MIRAVLRPALRGLMRVFFRRIELQGAERLPADGPAVLVANHPSSLVDPVLLVAFAPRPVAFLAKEPLFRMPVIGRLARALDSIPVYRALDGADPKKNLETFSRARALLGRGGLLALFPEGTSHDDPRMKPLKTGAARIALGAASADEGLPLSVVPVGLVFTDKGTFRSEVLLSFGAPIPVEPAALSAQGEPEPAEVRALTGRIQDGLAALVLQAESDGALALAAAAERLLAGEEAPLAERVALRQRLLAGRSWLLARDPDRLAALERRLTAHLALREAAGLREDAPLGTPPADALSRALRALVVAPAALVGTAIHLPAWELVAPLARRLARGDQSMYATLKLGLGLLCYPVTWLAVGVAAGLAGGAGAGVLAAIAAALSGAAALWLSERSAPLRALARGLLLRVGRRGALERLRLEREALRAELVAAADEIPTAGASG